MLVKIHECRRVKMAKIKMCALNLNPCGAWPGLLLCGVSSVVWFSFRLTKNQQKMQKKPKP